MEDSWSFDGSIVSLSESIGPSNNAPASSLRPDGDSAVSAHEENNRTSSAAAPPETSKEPAFAFSASRMGDMSTAAPPAERDERDRACGPTCTPVHLAGASTGPAHALSETAVGQTVSRGRPGTRTRGGGVDATTAPTRSTSVSSTTSTDGSAASSSSLPSLSTKMSDAETTSEQDGAGTSAFVMPSLNMGGGTTTAARYRPSPATTEHSSGPEAAAATSQLLRPRGGSDSDGPRILVLGSTADDRRTFAKLVSLDDDDEDRSRNRVQSSASSEGVTDMSFSFLSTRPAPSSHRTEPRSAPLPRPGNDDETFEALSPRAGSAILYQLTADELSPVHLLDKLQMPFERLEAKISRTYPATDRLADLVSSTSCGSFDACLFLFSSPPTAREVALARPVSRLVPMFPVLLLPPPPSGKSQKTNALCHAVQEQLNGADVRWLPASSLGSLSRRHGRSVNGGGGGGPLFMLPHDLFAQQPPPVLDPHPGPSGDSPPFSATSSSRDSPTSLASSQELFALPPTPHSPALTAMSSAPPSSIGTGEERPGRHGARRESGGGSGSGVRSLLASGPPSMRAGSSASRSNSRRTSQQRRRRNHRRGEGGGPSSTGGGGGSSSESDSTSDSRHMYGSSTSLADLKRLQFILHDPSLSDTLHQLAARVFLEWREVEIAAAANGSSRGPPTAEPRADLPSEWGEALLGDERGAFQDTGTNARKGLDFSRRVAERRQALRASAAPSQSRGISELEQTQTEENEAEGAPITASTTRESTTSSAYWTDPTTPRCIQRGLPSFVGGTGGATTLDRTGGEGYFPSTSNAGVPWLDSASEFASSSTEAIQQPTTAPRSLSPTSLVYLSPADPFHLPSLIHLVGLNLRLAFDPAAALARSPTSSAPVEEETAAESTKSSSTSIWSWWRAAATVGLVFAAGVAIGAHVISKRTLLFGPAPTLTTAAVIASPADWASWSPAVLIRS